MKSNICCLDTFELQSKTRSMSQLDFWFKMYRFGGF